MASPSVPPGPPDPGEGPLLSQRAALILVTAFVIGGLAGGLSLLGGGNLATSLLAGLTAWGASILGLHKLIGH